AGPPSRGGPGGPRSRSRRRGASWPRSSCPTACRRWAGAWCGWATRWPTGASCARASTGAPTSPPPAASWWAPIQSHLDMGRVKHALGDHGKNLIALAAKDYFFDSWRGFYFKNFTNLLPMERQRSLKESLRLASEVIASGLILLIFPEGTRSPSGQMA